MVYEFEGLKLDPASRRLQRVATGEIVPLTAKPLDALIYLVEHRDGVVEKEALLKALWPRVVVEENSLERCISTLRRALGETAGDNRFIATVPGRGYRFVAKVAESNGTGEVEPPGRPPGPPRNRTALVSALALAGIVAVAWVVADYLHRQTATSESKALVLLVRPFQNTSGIPEDDPLAIGMTEALRQQLTGMRGVELTSRGDAQGITNTIEGSFFRSGETLQIRVRLVDTKDGRQLWAQDYTRRPADSIALQEDVASTITQALFPSVNAVIAGADTSQPLSRNPEAQRLFLEANRLVEITPENLRSALSLYSRAIELDPQFAQAWAIRSVTYISFLAFDMPVENALVNAQRDADRAMELDSGLAGAWVARGGVLAYQGRLAESRLADDKALALQPDDQGIRFGRMILLAATGTPHQSLHEAERLLQQTPTSLTGLLTRGFFRSMTGDDAGAMDDLDSARPRGADDARGRAPDALAHASIRAGRYEDAARQLNAALDARAKSLGLDRLFTQAFAALRDRGRTANAARELANFVARNPPRLLSTRGVTTLLLTQTLTGDVDSAYRTINAYLDGPLENGVDPRLLLLLWMPEMKPFRRDARFGALAERLGLVEYWQKYGPPEFCKLEGRELQCE